MARSQDQVLRGILTDLPPGWAFPKGERSTFGRLLSPLTGELSALEASMEALLEEADPRSTVLVLDEWERAFGLPDECTAALWTLDARRAAIVARLTERLSPTPASFIALARALGVETTITEHHAHTTEHDTEDAVTDEEWQFVWTMIAPSVTMVESTTEDDSETPLAMWAAGPHECAVRRRAPAHTLVRFGSYAEDWDFSSGTLPPGAALYRASPGTRIGAAGQLLEAAVNAARWDYDPVTLAMRGLLLEALATSYVTNPRMQGAVAGAPGSLPSGWVLGTVPGGLTWTVVAVGVEDGIAYFDIRFAGTSAGGALTIRPVTSTAVAAALGQTWTCSIMVALRAGTLNGLSAQVVGFDEVTATGTFLTSTTVAVAAPTAAALSAQRRAGTATMTNAAVQRVAPFWRITTGAGQAVDATLRIGAPQLERGSAATSIILPPVGAPAVTTRAADLLVLDVPDGTYDAEIIGGTFSAAGTSYPANGLVAVGGLGLLIDWPAAAIAAGERHLQRIHLRKVL